jgi:hypothetical protein
MDWAIQKISICKISDKLLFFKNYCGGNTAMHDSQKFIIKTGSGRTYLLHVHNTAEYQTGKFVGLLLYYDDKNPAEGWQNMRHRVMFENSVDAIKAKVIEYANGRGESVWFI